EPQPGPHGAGRRSAEGGDLAGLGPLLALLDVERHALAFVEALVPVLLDRGVVHEHVRAATVGCEEAVALLAVEPLDGAFCHSCSPRTPAPGLCKPGSPTRHEHGVVDVARSVSPNRGLAEA